MNLGTNHLSSLNLFIREYWQLEQNNKGNQPETNGNSRLSPELAIPYPMLWLALVAFMLYVPSFFYGLTNLDDTALIVKQHAYNAHPGSLITSFHRGVFLTSDHYYRPVFLDSVVLNYLIDGLNPAGYHIFNVLFHVIAVLLLYRLFGKLGIKKLHAFLLCILFAVHPALSQAVAWIPGRNDTLLAIFTFSFFIRSINFTNSGKTADLLLSLFFFLLALFTKETAIFAAPAALVLLICFKGQKWNSRTCFIQYIAWACCSGIWLFMRSQAHLTAIPVSPLLILKESVYRSPTLLQYLGKIGMPFNLSVYPLMKDTVFYYGIITLGLLIAAWLRSGKKNPARVVGGCILFILFLLPALLVPSFMNLQAFEHRLYLPVIGILLILPDTILLNNKLSGRQLLLCWLPVILLFAGINLYHQSSFTSPLAFWRQAVRTSPHSPRANMMLAMEVPNAAEAASLLHKASVLNPKEKYLNFNTGMRLIKDSSLIASEPSFLAEKQLTGYYECDYYLAKAALAKQDTSSAVTLLRSYINQDPYYSQKNKSTLLSNADWQQPKKAKAMAVKMLK